LEHNRRPLATLKVEPVIRDRMKALKKELGFRTYDSLINFMVLEVTKGGAIPPASFEQVFDKAGTRPIILTGESGSGKSTTLKALLAQWSGNVFLLDVANEYPELKPLDLGQFFSLNWKREGQRVRFVPNANLEASKGEAVAIFGHLNFVMHSGDLRNWALVVEEAHRFGGDPNLRALLIEARKYVRKLIVVTTDWRTYEGIAKAFKPSPW
jgi:AAA domain